MSENLFRQAHELLSTKDRNDMTEEELKLVSKVTAFFANELPKAFPGYDEMPISSGLEKLAKMVEGVR